MKITSNKSSNIPVTIDVGENYYTINKVRKGHSKSLQVIILLDAARPAIAFMISLTETVHDTQP